MKISTSRRDPIFIHSLFRSGSTWLFSKLRKVRDCWCYQEPFHELLIALNEEPDVLLGFQEETSHSLRHPILEKPYFYEFHEIRNMLVGKFSGCISYQSFFDPSCCSSLDSYVSQLIKYAKGRAILQCCRSFGRMEYLKERFGGTHVYLWRDPRSQWWSYQINNYFEAINLHILNATNPPPIIARIRTDVASITKHVTVNDFDISHHTLNSKERYIIFYSLWLYGFLSSKGVCSFDLSIDHLSTNTTYLSNINERFHGIGVNDINLMDANIPIVSNSIEAHDFFKSIEVLVNTWFVQAGYPQHELDEIENKMESCRMSDQPNAQATSKRDNHIHLITIRYADALVESLKQNRDIMEMNKSKQKDIEYLLLEKENNRIALNQAQIESYSKQEQISSLEIEQLKLQTNHEKTASELISLEKRIIEYIQERTIQIETLANLQNEIKHERIEVKKYKEEQLHLIIRQDELKTKLDESRSNLSEVSRKYKKCEVILKNTQFEVELERGSSRAFSSELSRLRKSYDKILAKYAVTKKNLDHRDFELDDKTQEIGTLRKDLSNKKIIIVTIREELEQNEIKINHLYNALHQQNIKIVSMAGDMERILNSHSWRITKPLRLLKLLTQSWFGIMGQFSSWLWSFVRNFNFFVYDLLVLVSNVVLHVAAILKRKMVQAMRISKGISVHSSTHTYKTAANKDESETRVKLIDNPGEVLSSNRPTIKNIHEVYREILKRAPEGQDVINHYLAFKDVESIRDTLMSSTEYNKNILDIRPLDPCYLEAIRSCPPFEISDQPEYSIIILQYNKSQLTINCINSLSRYTNLDRVEIIVVDNGSDLEHKQKLVNVFGDSINLLCVGINRYFGEGNNIGVEAARASKIVIMNNDIAVTSGWLRELNSNLNHDSDVVGPAFLYPNGLVQECGGYISSKGDSERRHRLEEASDLPVGPIASDYISAALILLYKKTFIEIGGFDLCYEPAYYEDVDLCFKIRLQGGSVICDPRVKVFHNENATSADDSHGLFLSSNVVEVNKLKFLDRWGSFLLDTAILKTNRPGRKRIDISSFNPKKTHNPSSGRLQRRERVILFSPYSLTPGGGERYLLSIAQYLSKKYEIYLTFPYPYSNIRIQQLANYLSLDLSNVNLINIDQARKEDWDISFVLGNSIEPPFCKMSTLAFYICQFPFDHANFASEEVKYHSDYIYICYSNFVKGVILANNSMRDCSVQVIYPPVHQYGYNKKNSKMVLSVGRFFTGGHCKNQHKLIDAFDHLTKDPRFADWKLVLAGSTRPEFEHREYFAICVARSKGLNVDIIPDVSPDVLSDLYASASLYWHGAGVGIDVSKTPELVEHFGITPLEAASAGCLTFVPNRGGPAEISHQASSGFYSYESMRDLVDLSKKAMRESSSSISASREYLVEFAQGFSELSFESILLGLVDKEFNKI